MKWASSLLFLKWPFADFLDEPHDTHPIDRAQGDAGKLVCLLGTFLYSIRNGTLGRVFELAMVFHPTVRISGG